MANKTKWTPEKRAQFCAQIAAGGTIGGACQAVGLSRARAYALKDEDEAFAAAWTDAEETAVERLEVEADRRAVEGTLKPVFYNGEECGHIREFSDTLLIFRLKALRPDKYRERPETIQKGHVTVRLVRFGDDKPAHTATC